MSFDEYQELAHRTQNTALSTRDILNQSGLGIAGEAGEVADEIKKYLFHGHSLDYVKLKKELGDVLWYVAEIAGACGLDLSDVAETNIAKLRARYPEGFTEERSRNRGDE